MSDTPHKLAEEFPDHIAQIRHLKAVDGHFARIADMYDDVNHQIHLAETDIEPADDARMTEMRRKRMQLKDEIYGMLVRAEPEAEKLG
jgi:uncharacterized protein YdcH (DUF465 family)